MEQPLTGSLARKEDTVGILARQDTATRRIRIIHLLRRTFGEDLEKLPQFSALVNCLKYECSHTFTEVAIQTNSSANVNGNNGEETLRRRLINSCDNQSDKIDLQCKFYILPGKTLNNNDNGIFINSQTINCEYTGRKYWINNS